MKVAVCIPAYNAAAWLGEAIESATGQTLRPDEICVWSDGSTDATCDIAHSYGVKVAGSAENRGIAAAHNAAASMAASDVIILMGADDRLKPEYIERILPAFDNPEVAMVSTLVETFGEPCHGIPQPRNHTRSQWRDAFYQGNYLFGGAMFRREVFVELGGFDQSFAHLCDLELFVRIVKRFDIRVIEEALYEYRVRTGSASRMSPDNGILHNNLMAALRRKHYRWRSIDGQLTRAA